MGNAERPTGRLKSYTPSTFKAVGQTFGDETLEEGQFIALGAVFGNIDSYGERIVEGAFSETLAEWAASGDPIPVIWQHDWSNPDSHIGYVLWAKETPEGLLYKGQLDLDHPRAAQVYRLMKGRRVTQQSIGFDILNAAEVIEDEKYVFEIHKVKLYEIGPCLVGVNTATDLLDIKGQPGANPTHNPNPDESTDGEPAASTVVDPTDSAATVAEPDAATAAPDEQSSQGDDAAADQTSVSPGSVPGGSASKSITPASVLLALEIETLEGEISNG